jgi:D-ribose pyranase
MGHMDTLVIADAGLPIPWETNRIDLALKEGVPGFLETLEVVLEELQVESVLLAEEIFSKSPELAEKILYLIKEIPIERVPHEEFKNKTSQAKAVIRTGEFTPYANIILVAGVTF